MPSKRLKLTQEMVATAKENLEAIPAAPKEMRPITVSEAIRALTPTIRKLFDRGHSREAVIALLKEQGIECSPSTFKECYRPGKTKATARPADAGAASRGPAPGQTSPESGSITPRPPAAVLPVASSAAAGPGVRPSVATPVADTRADQRPNAGQPVEVAKAS